ncbi:hypothetical protein ACFLS1_02370 [Verrucomicrobiota bacterium]
MSDTKKSLRERVVAVFTEAGKPLNFEQVFARLQKDELPLPVTKPKLVVRKVLYDESIFESKGQGLFVVKEDASVSSSPTAKPKAEKAEKAEKEEKEEKAKKPKKSLRGRVMAVFAEAGKPLNFEQVFARLQEDGLPLPVAKPKLVVRKVLYDENTFESKSKGLFVLKEGIALEADSFEPVKKKETVSEPAAKQDKTSAKKSGRAGKQTNQADTKESKEINDIREETRKEIERAKEKAKAEIRKEIEQAREEAKKADEAEEAKKKAKAEARKEIELVREEARKAAKEAAEMVRKEAEEEARKEIERAREEAREAAKEAAAAARKEAEEEARKEIERAREEAREAAEEARKIAAETAREAAKAAAEAAKEAVRKAAKTVREEVASQPASQDAISGSPRVVARVSENARQASVQPPLRKPGEMSLRERINVILDEVNRPMGLEEIVRRLKKDGRPLPKKSPVVVISHVLGNGNLFQEVSDGFFIRKEQ